MQSSDGIENQEEALPSIELPVKRKGKPRVYDSEAQRKRVERSSENEKQRSERLKMDQTRHINSRQLEDEEQRSERLKMDQVRHKISRQLSRNSKIALMDGNFQIPQIHSLGKLDVKCVHCGSLFFKIEQKRALAEFDQCCNFGHVKLEMPKYSKVLLSLLNGNSPEAQNFRKFIRNYNNGFAMASLSAKLDVPHGNGPYCYRIHGQMYHLLAPMSAEPGKQPMNIQLYFLDSDEANKERLGHPANQGCIQSVLESIESELNQVNPYIKSFKLMKEVMQEEESKAQAESKPSPIVQMIFDTNRSLDRRRYNAPITNEVAAVFVFPNNDEIPPSRQYSVVSRNGTTQFITEISPICDPLTYPILYPYGENGWHPDLEKADIGTRKRVRITQMEYYKFFLAIRENSLNVLLKSGKFCNS
jgi:hypothetical protein